MVGDHQEAWRYAAARVVKPQEEHSRGIRERPFLRKGPVFAFSVTVDIWDGGDPRIGHLMKSTRNATFAKVGV
jgi:hypothetical protein